MLPAMSRPAGLDDDAGSFDPAPWARIARSSPAGCFALRPRVIA